MEPYIESAKKTWASARYAIAPPRVLRFCIGRHGLPLQICRPRFLDNCVTGSFWCSSMRSRST